MVLNKSNPFMLFVYFPLYDSLFALNQMKIADRNKNTLKENRTLSMPFR